MWYLANQETFRSVADRFGMSKGSLHYYLRNFTHILTSEDVLPKVICWPDIQEYPRIAEKFAQRAGFPGVIGAVDGTYIPIPGPKDFRDSYICRKGFPAFHLQAVCDKSLRFLDVFCAYPGSVHDSRAFRNSPLNARLENQAVTDYHLIGDSAYALKPYLMTPFRDNGHLTSEQKKYNSAHSSTRVEIERSFGLLKGKFRKLKFLDMTNVSDMPFTIVSCCVLHNFVLLHEALDEEELESSGEEEDTLSYNPEEDETSALGSRKRTEIMHLLA